MIQIIDAIRALVPNAECTFSDTKIVRWLDFRVQPSQEEIDAKFAELQAAEPLRLLRIERNRLISLTDWRVTEDYPNADKEAWKTYRQSLRDLPATAEPQLDKNGMLTNITWPEVPE